MHAELTRLNKDEVAKTKTPSPPHAFSRDILYTACKLCARTAISVLIFSNTGNITRFIKLHNILAIAVHWALRQLLSRRFGFVMPALIKTSTLVHGTHEVPGL